MELLNNNASKKVVGTYYYEKNTEAGNLYTPNKILRLFDLEGGILGTKRKKDR
jgi:hypothetical protein